MRVLLINPPSPERLGSPLLGLEYVAASLLAHGCEVRIIDAAARHFAHDSEWTAKEAESFAPRIIGVSLFTRWVWHAYGLVERLKKGPWLLVSGRAFIVPNQSKSRGSFLDGAGYAPDLAGSASHRAYTAIFSAIA